MNKKYFQKIKLIFSYFFYFFIFISIFFIIKEYINKINYFKINQIIISGNNFVSDDDIINSIDEELIENHILHLDLSEIQKNINSNSFINASKIYTQFPSTIYIDIKEINPIGIFERNNKIF